jgi:ABC-2 type transport system permease protein
MVASFSALGIYFSGMTQQPVIAAILTFIALFALMMLDRFFAGDPNNILGSLSLMKHFQSFSNGLIDTADIAYFVLFAVTSLTLTVRRLDADCLRG